MSIVVQTTGVAPGALSTTCVIVKPSGLAAGDLMIACVVFAASNVNTSAITPPTGWSTILDQGVNNGTNDVRHGVFYKIADSTDASATDFTFTCASGSNIGAIIRVTGFDSTTPIGNKVSTTYTGTSFPNTNTSPLPTVIDSLLVMAAGNMPLRSASAYTVNNGGASFTEHADINTTAGLDSSIFIVSSPWPSTSDPGFGAWTPDASITTGSVSMFFVNPAPTALKSNFFPLVAENI